MRVIDAGVQHRHHDAAAAGGDVPGVRGVDGGHAPELAVLRVAGDRLDLVDGVPLEAGDVSVGGQPVLDTGQRGAAAADHHHAGHAQAFDDLELDAAAGQQARRLGDRGDAVQRSGVELNDPVVDVVGCGRRRGGSLGGGRRGRGALDGPIGDPGVAGSARHVLKPCRGDLRGDAGGVHQVAAFERLDPQAALKNAGLTARRFAKQPILIQQNLAISRGIRPAPRMSILGP